MAKKNKKAAPPKLSPEQYIKQKGRSLPIEACYIGEGWEECGVAMIWVARKHVGGTYTVGVYMIDTFCKGLMQSSYKFSISLWDYEDLFVSCTVTPMEKIDYVLAHNLIYGSIAYAEEAGIALHDSFRLTQYILEEDTEDVPLVECTFGKDGKHFLVATSPLDLSRYLPKLQSTLSEDEYTVKLWTDDDQEEEEDDEIVMPPELYMFKENMEKMQERLREKQTPYLYKYPDYPTERKVKYSHLVDLFYDPKYSYSLPEKEIDAILALPHEELRQDLEQMALFEIGSTCGHIPEELWKKPVDGALMHILFFLGELGDTRSLDVVLEVMRQNHHFYEYHLGDYASYAITPTLYLLGRDCLSDLMKYVHEPGLYTFFRIQLFEAVALIVHKEPDRREEVLEWFREVLQFYIKEIRNLIYCDGILTGMMISFLLKIKAIELLPEIKALYDTGYVDEMCCGNYKSVEFDIKSTKQSTWNSFETDIKKRYKQLER